MLEWQSRSDARSRGIIISAVGVVFTAANRKSSAYMQEIDVAIDDGVLATGYFQRFNANRYFFIVAQ